MARIDIPLLQGVSSLLVYRLPSLWIHVYTPSSLIAVVNMTDLVNEDPCRNFISWTRSLEKADIRVVEGIGV